jgi:hypothetical protein
MPFSPCRLRLPLFHALAAMAAWSLVVPGTSIAQPWKTAPEKISRGPDLVGQAELSAPRDPTFDSVARHFPMLAAPREALGVLESAREFIVTRYGEIELNNLQMDKPGQPEAYPSVHPDNKATLYFLFGRTGPKTRYGEGNPPDSKRLVDGYLPMVIVPFTFQGVEYRQTIFAWSRGMDPDGRLWAYVGLEMKNPTGAAVRVELAHQAICGTRGRVVPTGSWDIELSPGETRRMCLRIPRDGIVPDKEITKDSPELKERKGHGQLPFCGGFEGIETVEPADFDRCFEEVAQTWRKRLNRAMAIRVPEARVTDAYRTWLAYLFTNVDKEGDRYLPHDGSGFYELVWGIAAIQACRAMDLYGYSGRGPALPRFDLRPGPAGRRAEDLFRAVGLGDPAGGIGRPLPLHARQGVAGARRPDNREGLRVDDRAAGQGEGRAGSRFAHVGTDQVPPERRLSRARLQFPFRHGALRWPGGGGARAADCRP